MQSKLADVRAKADEARMAKLRSNLALYEGLSAAYDFALDAEDNADEYLKLVEAQGLKIQLRAPMAPVARLAFEGSCEPATIAQMEKVLAWALKEELPRGQKVDLGTVGTLEEILTGPSHTPDGSMNLFGALRRTMAKTGYRDLKEFQRVDLVIGGRDD